MFHRNRRELRYPLRGRECETIKESDKGQAILSGIKAASAGALLLTPVALDACFATRRSALCGDAASTLLDFSRAQTLE
jgi:hypothetical protein